MADEVNPHAWIPSRLGHGETMCSRCYITNREAAVLGVSDRCDIPQVDPHVAKAAEMFNVPVAQVTSEMRGAAKARSFAEAYGVERRSEKLLSMQVCTSPVQK